jgi:HSP20 family protein
MYFIKVRPNRDLARVDSNMQQFMNEVMNLTRPVLSPSSSAWMPETDMYETGDEVIMIMNLAGVRKEYIDVSFHKNYLHVEGKRIHSIPPNVPVRYHQMEIGHGKFERMFRIPATVDEEQIQASYADGLLTIRMKKEKRPRSVPVEVKM